MDSTTISKQTAAAPSVRTEFVRDAPEPRALISGRFDGRLQWALEGSGWGLLRPALDFVLLGLAVMVALGPTRVSETGSRNAPLLALPAIVLLLVYVRGLYRRHLRALVLDHLAPLVSAVSVGTMGAITLGLVMNGNAPEGPATIRAWVFAGLAVCSGRLVLSLAQRWARRQRIVGKPVLIIGAGVVGSQVARRLENHPEYGLVPVGFLDEDPRSSAEVGGREMPVLGTIEDLDEAIRATSAHEVIVAFSSVGDHRVSRLIDYCQRRGLRVSVVPRMFDAINNRVGYDSVGGLPLMSFTSVDPRGIAFMLKHAFDRLFALAMLVLLLPVMLIIALLIRVTSPGPVFFRQRRVGRDGKPFDLFKFRSMRVEDELPRSERGGSAVDFLLAGDIAPGGVEGEDRRTPVGRFLRRYSLDELPQLFNVVRGDMSVIGPRPERPEFVALFRDDVSRYDDRLRVRAGITGWAQVHGLRGQTSLAERVEWDNYYIAHWSLGLDLKILMLTVVALLKQAE
ncbi:MAG TPA: sugar transferase [Solirubrobacteraceae bacterium]|nr:sugar transferase [Solirubrobacteraceae bacterium]